MTDEELNELPQELRDQLRTTRQHGLEDKLTKLFDDYKQRTINDVLVDYWHAHKEVLKRGTVVSALSNMEKRKVGVRRAGKGVYVTVKPMPAPAMLPAQSWPAGVPHPADRLSND